MKNIEIPESLKKLNSMATSNIYIVGGYVRNYIAGLGKTDIDLAGPGIAEMLGIGKRYQTKVVNFKLGTAVIKYNDDSYEYTPFRMEKYAEGGEHTPVEVMFTTDLNQDAKRRDFTCNSIYYDITNDKIIDPYNGVQDIERKLLRAYNPKHVFASDGLRILRMVRLAVELGFKIDGETAIEAKKHVELLADISAERKREELNKILLADTKYGKENAHYRGVKLLNQLGIWKYLIPQLEDGAGVEQNPKYHKYDVLEHTFQTVRFAPPEVRLAALMHDIGKPYCMKKYGNMHGHERVSANIVKYRLGEYGLKYPNDVIDEVAWLCLNHMYDMQGNTKEGKMRVFVATNFDKIDKLVSLIKADRMATGMVDQVGELRIERVKKELIEEKAPLSLQDLAIDGSILIMEGIQPVKIGGILNELWTECIISPRLNNKDWLLKRIKNIV